MVAVQTLAEMKAGKAPGHSYVPLEVFASSGEVGTRVMAEMCQSFLDGLRMPAEWALTIV